ncbi:MAG TPA: carboxypeptidase-like regulatory domain-containing protein, partial [Haliangium sp.]|nr:carboxypeptidase-like regulatory domain-containing protein [Haliangium sp.]
SRRAVLAAMGIALASGLALGFLLWPDPEGSPGAPADAGAAGDAHAPLLTPPPLPTVPVTPRAGQGSITLPGDVVDAAGEPVQNAAVTAELELGPGLAVVTGIDATPAVVASTDAKGAFALVGLSPGRYRLRVEGQGIFTAEVRFFEVPAQSVRLVVTREVAIAGSVVDPAGGPVADLPVTLLRDDAIVAQARTDARGGFGFEDLSEGVFEVWAGGGTRASAAESVTRLGTGPFEPVTLTLGPAAIVTGRVIDRKSKAGVRAAVTLAATAADQPVRYGASDLGGNFRIEAVPHGRWSIEAWAPGYLSIEAVELEVGRAVEPVVALTPGGVLAGRVVDHRGRAVEGAVVRARGVDAEGRAVAVSQQDQLDRTRRFRGQAPLDALPEGTRFLARGELGVLLGPIPFPPPPGAASLRVTERVIEPAAAATGAPGVPGLPGAPGPPGAPAAAEDWAAAASEHAATYVTDAQGRFRLTGVPPGRFQVAAAHPDYADGETAFVLLDLGQRREDLTVTLVPGVLLVGAVTNTRKEPIIGAVLTVEPLASGGQGRGRGPGVASRTAGDSGGRLQAVTGSDGRYRLGPIAGDVRVHVTAVGHGDAERAVRLGAAVRAASAAGQPAERTEDFVLVVADATLEGRVRDAAGFPVRSAQVAIDSDERHAAGRSAITDDDGRFSIAALAAGTYRLQIKHPQFPTVRAQGTTGTAAELTLPLGGGIEGLVRDAHTSGPIAAARVVATGPDDTGHEVATGADGSFSLAPLAVGSWTLAVTAPGYVPVEAQIVDVKAGREPGQVTARDVRIQLERGATVAGTVRDANGQRVAGATVRAGQVEARSDVEGKFRLSDVPTGRTEVTADLDGAHGSVIVPLRPGDEVLTLEISIQ